ncbi:30S ribosomal protein S9 [bacterium]|nr:30S ribosomal protein S9 [bacterium]
MSAQADAIKLGLSRSLAEKNEGFKKILKADGFLTRDSRIVERKKPGKKKARKSPSWSKR